MNAFRHRPAALCGLGLLVLSLFSFASRAAESAQLPSVVVTATRIPQALANTLSDVRIVDAQAIRDAGAATLAELLQVHGGVEIASNGGPGQTSALYIRGSNANHVLVLVDGVRINSATAGTTALENLPLAQIERIEIVRGAASSLYGADAIGGVIQIFTKRGERSEVRVGTGSRDTHDLSAGLGRRFGDTSVDLQAGYRESRAFSATHPGIGSSFNPDVDRYRNRHLAAALAHDWATGQSLSLRGMASMGSTRFDSGAASDDVSRQRLASLALESRNRLLAQWTSLVRVARGTDDTKISGGFSSRFRTDQDQFTWQNDIAAVAGQVATGVEWRRDAVDADTAYTQTRREVRAAFASYAAGFDAHSVQVSLRHDDDSQFGGHVTGNLAYGYRLASAWRLSAGGGSAFKAPTFADLYFPRTDFSSPGFPFFYAGNPALRPERSRSIEAALRFDEAAWNGALTLFRNQVRDLIASGALPNDPATSSVVNLAAARSQGATLSAGHATPAWRVGGEWTRQSALDTATGERLLRRARDHAAASAAWTPGPWRVGAEWVASGDREDIDFATFPSNRVKLGGYALVNLHAGYALTPELSVSARLANATGKHFELVRGYNTAPRNLFVALEYSAR